MRLDYRGRSWDYRTWGENNFNDLVPAKLIHFTTHKDEICNSLYKQQKKNTVNQ